MFNKKLAYKIKSILFENPDKYLTIKDISKIIRTKKHQYRDLKDTLVQLAKEKKIIRQGHSYKARKKKKNPIPEKDRYITGKFDATPLARNYSYGFVITEDSDVMIHGEDISTAYHDDVVKVEITYLRGNRRHGRIINIISRGNKTIVGTVDFYHKQPLLVCDSRKIHSDFLINDLNGAEAGKKVVLEVTNWGTTKHLPAGKVIEILGDSDDPEVEVLAIIRQNGLPLEFPKKVLAEAEEINQQNEIEEIEDRNDLRDLLTFTIDPISAKDFDDAISLKTIDNGYLLYVHIADVSHFITLDSALFGEAIRRGNSFYFPKRVIPMLPEKVSNGVCSLRPFEDKFTVTAEFQLSKDFEILSSRVYHSVIRSDARLNYEQVDLLFDKQDVDIPAEIAQTLAIMRKISKKLSQNRYDQGYINFDLPDTKYIYDDEGELTGFERDEETESHKLIENFMLLANEFIANFLTKNAEHTLYRIHEKPDLEQVNSILDILQKNGIKNIVRTTLHRTIQSALNALETEEKHRVFDSMILRSMKKAKYHHQHIEHFGLAMQTYTHFTSPIRRLCDLIIHHQLKNILKNRKQPFSFGKIKKYGEIASERELLAQDSERQVEFIFKRRFMKDKIGEEFSAIVTGMNQAVIFVELDDYPIRGVVRMAEIKEDYFIYNEDIQEMRGRKSGRRFRLGTKLDIVLSKVEEEIIFVIQ